MKIGEMFRDQLEFKLKREEEKIRTLDQKSKRQIPQGDRESVKKIESLYKKQNEMRRMLNEVKKMKRQG